MNNPNHSRTVAARLFAAALLLASAGSALAVVRYVDVNSTNATPPFTNWAAAATNIQDAVDAAVAGDEIVVTNGIYATGGRDGNRVAVDKPLSVRSVNGPLFTIIDGVRGVRCVYLTNLASLSGFTLTNGRAQYGGGLFCATNAVVSNCVISGNLAVGDAYDAAGGGAYGGTLNDCTLTDNSAQAPLWFSYDDYVYYAGDAYGGGAAYCTLNNCTLTGNSVRAPFVYSAYSGVSGGRAYGGGAAYCTLNNCALTGNRAHTPLDSATSDDVGGRHSTAAYGGGAYGCTLRDCVLTNNDAQGYWEYVRIYDRDHPLCRFFPEFCYYYVRVFIPGYGGGAAGGTLNNCTLIGNVASYGGGTYGGTLNNCITYFNTSGANYLGGSLNYSCTTPLPADGVGNITNEPAFVNLGAGNYRLRADSPCIDAGTNLSASITNDLDGRPRPLDGNGDGLAAFDMGAYEYRTPLLVWQDSPNPTPPHADWATAATNIQDAVDAAVPGDEIVVTNGIYATGGRATVSDSTLNRVVVDKPLSIRSVNGSESTIIRGGLNTRCVYLTNGTSLTGFTLTRAFLDYSSGGGAWGGTLNNCTLTRNSAYYNGGGALYSTLNNCVLTRNSSGDSFLCCDNSDASGGGAAHCTLNNCTLNGNWTVGGLPWGGGGGAYGGDLNNCIVYFNSRRSTFMGTDFFTEDNYGGYAGLHNCCTTPNPYDFGNNIITNAPLFVDTNGWANLRLQSNSPCINAGNNTFAPAGLDLDGNPRIAGGTVDIGAYEFQSPASTISYAWLQQYNLPIAAATDGADPDGDGMNNWQEWRCTTDPTNALSALRLLPPVSGGPNGRITWQSVSGVSYFLERSMSLSASPAFTPLATGIPGQPGSTGYTDTNAIGTGPFFYRVGVGD